MARSVESRVLQFCHGYDGPFLDCARQYASLFENTPYKVTTVFLTGKPNADVVKQCASDEVLFMNFTSEEVRGLKLKAIRELKLIVASRNFKFCIAHRFKPIWVACLATSLPVIGVHHAFGDYSRLGRRLFANWQKKRLCFLGVSNAVRDDIRRSLSSWEPERIETLYNRIDVDVVKGRLLSSKEARNALHLDPEAWIIGNVGRLHPDKDQATLLRAFAIAKPNLPKNSQLAIMGKGRLAEQLRGLAKELAIAENVLFLGQVDQARRYFKAFDLFALSSNKEPFGMVLLEAMAASIPLICSDCGGGREVVKDVGILFPFGDEHLLAEAMVRMSKLTPTQLQSCHDAMQVKLYSHFSDDSAMQSFWNLPFIQSFRI